MFEKLQPSMNDFEEVFCPKCENAVFSIYQNLYRLNALKSPTGKPQFYNVPVYACTNCGFILEPDSQESSVDKSIEAV